MSMAVAEPDGPHWVATIRYTPDSDKEAVVQKFAGAEHVWEALNLLRKAWADREAEQVQLVNLSRTEPEIKILYSPATGKDLLPYCPLCGEGKPCDDQADHRWLVQGEIVTVMMRL